MDYKKLSFALLGNPNCGKTTLFNSLTGSTAHVGNWPGVTVEKRAGIYKRKGGIEAEIVDLPGIYSLSPYTPEEVISRNYILDSHPDCVINVIDATNLERNLYMTTQVLEMDIPVILALNMSDALEQNGVSIDVKKLSSLFGVPIVLVSALRKSNLDLLMSTAVEVAKNKRVGVSPWANKDIDEDIASAKAIYEEENIANPLFHAIKALEGDEIEEERNKNAFDKVAKLNVNRDDFEANSADQRYQFITERVALVRKGIEEKASKKFSKSDKIDKLLTNKWLAIPFLILIMFFIFHLTFGADLFYMGKMGLKGGGAYEGLIHFEVNGEVIHPWANLFWDYDPETSGISIVTIGEFINRLFGGVLTSISQGVKAGMVNSGAHQWATGLVCDGILAGVTAVLGFLPQILILFAFFSILEDSGYMARIAFILDRIFRKFGVSGRAFLPMIMGFGCSVPAMINTRTLATDKERIKTIRAIPFFTCGAKAEVLVALAAVIGGILGFQKDLFTYGIYALGVGVALVAVIVMTKTTQREKVPPFIMELPEYHRPQITALLIHIWDKAKHFITKAFTIILLSTIIIWLFANFTFDWKFIPTAPIELNLTVENSILAGFGKLFSPIFTPVGFGSQIENASWVYSVATVQGIVAKEGIVGSLGELAGFIDGTDAVYDGAEAITAIVETTHISTGGLVGFTIFNMFTIPCFAAVATTKGELGSKKMLWLTLLFWVSIAYCLAALFYISIEWAWTLSITLPSIAAFFVGLYFYDRYKVKKEARA